MAEMLKLDVTASAVTGAVLGFFWGLLGWGAINYTYYGFSMAFGSLILGAIVGGVGALIYNAAVNANKK